MRIPVLCLILFSLCFSQSPAQMLNRSGQDTAIFISGAVFVPKSVYPSGEQNWSIGTGDFNRDGLHDLVTASKVDGLLNLHLNDGKGNFLQKTTFPGQSQHRALTVFDANGDGEADVAAVTSMGKLVVFLNQKGRLAQIQAIHTGVMAHDIAFGDVNGDGKPDLITAVVNDHSLKIHLNDGSGRFGAAIALRSGSGPRSVQAADLDQDGALDLIAGCDDGRLYLHFGDGKGSFQAPVSIRSANAVWALRVADLNGDERPDIAAAAYLDRGLRIHLNLGNRQFAREQELLSGDHNFDLEIADFDLDGDPDIVTCSTVDNAIHYHLNDGRGVFGPGIEQKSGDWNAALAAADFDGDGDVDVATSSINDHSINIHKNTSYRPEALRKRSWRLTGTVINADSREKLAKVPVSLLDAQGKTVATVVTTREGGFTFTPALNKDYTLLVRASGFPVTKLGFHMPDSSYHQDVLLSLPKGTFVFGRVYDETTGKSIAQADATIKTQADEVAAALRTDAQGNYRVELPFGLFYTLEGSAPDYEPGNKYFSLEEKHVPNGVRVDIPLKKSPDAGCFQAIVLDATTREPISRARIEVQANGSSTHTTYRASQDGTFRACVPFRKYELNTTAQGYFFKLDTIRHEKGLARTVILLTPLEKDLKIVLKNIYYDYDKATLRPESVRELDRLARIMQENPSLTVELSGHTDGDGSDVYNEKLSQARAQSVVDYLLGKGIETARLTAKGYGEQQPVAANDTPENKQLNRRTEFKVIGY